MSVVEIVGCNLNYSHDEASGPISRRSSALKPHNPCRLICSTTQTNPFFRISSWPRCGQSIKYKDDGIPRRLARSHCFLLDLSGCRLGQSGFRRAYILSYRLLTLTMLLLNKGQITNTMALAAFLIESCLYGVYATIFLPTVYLIWNHQLNSGFSTMSKMLGMAFVALFALSTIHLVLSLVMLFKNLVDVSDLTAGYQYASNGNIPINAAFTAVWVAIVMVADAIVVWRCWILWNKETWVLILFGLLEVAFSVCSAYSIMMFAHISTMSDIYLGSIMTWYTIANALSLVINFLLSGLICFKLYKAGRRIKRMASHAYTPHYYTLALTYIESGSIYPTLMIAGLASYLTGTPYGWVIIVIAPQILAMVPTIMFLIVLLKKQPFYESQKSHTVSSRSWSHGGIIVRPQASHPSSLDGAIGLEVHVTQEEFKLTDLTSPARVHVVDMA